MGKIKTVALFLVIIAVQIKANDSTVTETSTFNYRIQYAGNLGLVSVGIGKYSLYRKWSFHIVYGYLPKMVNGVAVHTIALKPSYKIAETQFSNNLNFSYYTGLTLLYGITRNTYLDYPDYYPDGYYMANAVHLLPHLGIQLNVDKQNFTFRRISFFTELGSLDFKIWSAVTTQSVNLFDIWSLCVGIGFAL